MPAIRSGGAAARAAMRRCAAVGVVAAMFVSTVAVVQPSVAAAATAEENSVANGLVELLDAVAGLADFDELGDVIPGTDLLPASRDALDLQAVVDEITATIDGLADQTTTNVESALNGLDGTALGAGVTLHIDVDVSTTEITFGTLRLERAVSTPLAVTDGEPGTADSFSLAGGSLAGDVVLDLTGDGPLVVSVDPGSHDIFLVDPGAITFTADLALAGTFTARLGILDVQVADHDLDNDIPTAAASVDIGVNWLDPDGDGRITRFELANSAPADLFDASITSGSLQLDVALSSGLQGLGAATGTVLLDDQDLTGGIDAPSFELGELGNFTNFTPQDVLAAIAQLAISIRGMQLKFGSIDLPLVDENLAELANMSDGITRLFTEHGLSVPDNPADLDIDQSLIEDLDTLEEIATALEAALGVGPGALGLEYLPDDDVVTFDIDIDDRDFFHDADPETDGDQPPTAAINVADELAGVGIKGLDLAGGASISVAPSYDLSFTVGLDLSGDLADPAVPITRRIFLEVGDGPELGFDAPVTGDLELTGTLSFLELQLADTEAGPVDLLSRREDDADSPMLAVDIAPADPSGRITLEDLFDALGGADVNAPDDDNTITVTGDGVTVTGLVNAQIPNVTLAATATIGETTLGSGATIELSWEDVMVGAPVVDPSDEFVDDFLSFNLDNEDPLALFTQILTAVEAAFGTMQSIDQDGAAADLVDSELPIVGTSMKDALGFLGDVRNSLNSLSSDPAGSIQELEVKAEAVILQALDQLDGVEDFALPTLPDPSDHGTGEDYNADAFEDAMNAYLDQLQTYVSANADFLTLRYEPGNSPGAVIVEFDLGICSDLAEYGDDGCSFAHPISQPFNVDLGEFGGGLVGADGAGTLAVDYNVAAKAHIGVQLPEVAPNPGGLPTIAGAPELFVLDSSGIEASIGGFADASFGASIGPFEVTVGDDVGIGEPDADCGNDTDDDGDGTVNDGCPPDGVAESADQCTNAVDDEEDDSDDTDADGVVNDGCPEVANPLQAQAGAAFTLANDLPGDGVQRSTDIAGYFNGLSGDFTANPSITCGDASPPGPFIACADLPISLDTDGDGGDDPTYLGTIALRASDFDNVDLDGEDEVFQNLADGAEGFLFQLLADGIREFGGYIERALSAEEFDADIPVVGDLLDAGADVGGTFNGAMQDLSGLVGSLDSAGDFPAVESAVRDFFWDAFGPDGADVLLNADDVITDGAATAPVKAEDIVVTPLCGDASSPVACDPDEDGAAHTMLDLVDVQVEFKLGQVGAAETADFDFGLPGLRLAGGEDALSATVDWQLNVGFGLSLSDGFYLLTSRSVDAADGTDGTDAGEDIQVRATVDLGTPVGSDAALADDPAPPAFTGDLAFIGVDVYNAKDDRQDGGDDGRNGHEVTLDLSVDIPDPAADDNRIGLTELVTGLDPRDWRVGLEADVDLLLNLVTSMDFGSGEDAGLPRILSDLSLQWQIDAQLGALETGEARLDVGDLAVGFDNVRLDLGSFISEFLAPALSEVQRLTKPLQPIIDTLRAPIPGVAELAELVGAEPITLLQLMEQVSGADLELIERLLDVLALVNSIPTDPGNVVIPIGDFGLDSQALSQPELPSNAKAALIDPGSVNVDADAEDGGVLTQLPGSGTFQTQMAKATGQNGGFTFPAFEDPTQLFQLLVGKDVTLVHFDAGALKASVSESFSFGPIALGPIPVSVVVSISAAIQGRFAMGYDTKGIRLLVKNLTDDDTSNDGFFANVGVLFAGVFLDDLDANGVDVPEIRLTLEGAVGAAVDLVIVKAGVEAGLRATLDMNLHDGGFVNPIPPENLDGKLRIDEIIQILSGNPICLFDVSGRLEAFIRIFVTIDLFLYSKTFRQTIVDIVLLELENITKDLCQPPPPVLATPVGDGILALNMGERAEFRDYDEENPTESFTVRQLSEGDSGVDIRVTAFGITQDYENVDKVVGSGADGKDKITAEPGVIAGVCQEDGSVQPPVGRDCEGDPATDEDDAEAGDTVEVPIEFRIPVAFCGGTEGDTLSGGNGIDLLVGDGKLNSKNQPTTCTEGGSGGSEPDGIDKITGSGGDDTIHGNADADDLNGNAGDDTITGGTGDDQITGGPGRDIVHGNDGMDSILGGPEADPCPGDDRDACSSEADDVINGDAGDDTIEGDHGRDTIRGGADNDVVVAGHGDDTVDGDGGHDQLFGNEGWDTVNGGSDDDDVVGGVGDDTLNGDAGSDDIIGEEGEDTIDGGSGFDAILGDKGSINRAPQADPAFDLADEELPLVTLVDGPASDSGDAIDGGDDADRIWGQEGGDAINGGAGDDIARGNEGDDTISGDAGADELFGDAGDDTIHGDDATGSHGAADLDDTIRGGNGLDTIEGNADGDRIFGDSGRDEAYGDAADEAPCGLDGDDRILGGPDGDLLFGNAGEDTVHGEGGTDRIVGGSDTSGTCDTTDHLFGGEGADVIAGDNATISDAVTGGVPVADDMAVTLLRDGEGAGDELSGDADDDRLFGQTGTDTIGGGAGHDYVEGNEDVDTINGDGGTDDLIGGSSADDGVIDDDRSGNGEPDAGDVIDGGVGTDWIAGDNAVITRNVPAPGRAGVELFDVATTTDAAATGTGGVDTINGGAAADRIFGQTAGDVIHGDGGDDYVEGNDGDDTINGDAGDDDLIGGGSAADGVIDGDRVGTTLLDVGEALISGGPGEDYIAGDNALVNRNVPSDIPPEIEVVLFDVFLVWEEPADPGTYGADLVQGDDGPDWIFGQGGDDPLEGNAGDDYVEGNEGDDTITGGAGDDDLVGGSSADDGYITWDRSGNELRDGGETLISGGSGQDWIAGDNALVNRNRPAEGPDDATRAPIELFDVQTVGGLVIAPETSGGDVIDGGSDDDRVFGQGNGDQPATQTDPADDRNNDFVGTDPGDDDFDRNTADPLGTDEDAVGWLGDVVHGGTGDDEIEGGHGNDLLFGNAPGATATANDDEDDMVGGGSADDGRIFDDERLGNGGDLLDGTDTVHGDGADATAGDDDVILGDNGWIVGTGETQAGPGPDGEPVDLPNRQIRTEEDAPDGTFGHDYLAGNGGHDDVVGQAGDDSLNGEYGSDALVGDLGRVEVDLVVEGDGEEACGAHRVIAPEQPFYEREICAPGTLFRQVELYAFDDTSSDVVSGEDVVLGGDGDDWVHGGPGVDMLQGDGDGGAEIQDPEFTYTQTIVDPNPASADSDRIFGGDSNGDGEVDGTTLGNGDVIWGGRGSDHLYGGHGADIIDVRPPADGSPHPESWSAWGEADVETYHGIDFSWGGYGRDAVQSNVAGNGPVPGDRVVDWVGVYNLSMLCPATYGAYVTIRAQSPKEIAFWEQAAEADGAFDVLDPGTSGHRELAMIYKPDIRHNNGRPYPGSPGHFFGCSESDDGAGGASQTDSSDTGSGNNGKGRGRS